jgi:hypothetical protein
MCRKNGKAGQSKERSNDIHDATYFLLAAAYASDCFRRVSSGRENRFVANAELLRAR